MGRKKTWWEEGKTENWVWVQSCWGSLRDSPLNIKGKKNKEAGKRVSEGIYPGNVSKAVRMQSLGGKSKGTHSAGGGYIGAYTIRSIKQTRNQGNLRGKKEKPGNRKGRTLKKKS